MNKLRRFQGWLLGTTFVVISIIFGLLYVNQMAVIEKPNYDKLPSSLEDWTIENSDLTGRPLEENKGLYSDGVDSNIYDVYLNVFPTKDENGKLLDFSAFDLHTARDHTYNPVLKCNIQIMNEGESPSLAVITDVPNATIRVRGNSSRGSLYKSYKIKAMGENDLFQGQSSLNVNKHSEDRVKATTKLCADLLMNVDNIATYRTNFMRVWIKDSSLPDSEQEYTYYGLYTHTEQPNKSYLEARNLTSNCEMYKARDFSFATNENLRDVTDPNYSVEKFEEILTIREATSHSKVIEMVNAVNDMSRDFEDIFEEYFNEDNYITWLAFNMLVGASDILNHNFIIYSPNNSKTWYFIPWDFDSNLQGQSRFIAESLSGGQKLNMVVLHRRYLRIPGNLEKLDKKMKELLQTALSPEQVTKLTNLYLPVLEKTMPLNPDLDQLIETPNKVYEYLNNYSSLIQENYDLFKKTFNFPAPMYVGAPTKNADGTLHLKWEPSHSFQGRTITYDVAIYNDYSRKQTLFQTTDLTGIECDTDIKLEPGTYYLDVRPVDSEGNTQYSLEHYEFSGTSFVYENGLLEFDVK